VTKFKVLLSLSLILIAPACYGQAADSLDSALKNPVILVPGFFDKASRMMHIEKYLKNKGWEVYSVNLSPSTGRIGIDELAAQLADFAKVNIGTGRKFDLVGYSMGGLVCRYYIQRLGGLQHIVHLILISTPNHGTRMGYMLNNKGARQMRINSNFINDLNRDSEMLGRLKTTSIWTPLDLTVSPAKSSLLNIGDEFKIWCPLHFLMVYNNQSAEAVRSALLK
jgi:triacylglycerol lipase